MREQKRERARARARASERQRQRERERATEQADKKRESQRRSETRETERDLSAASQEPINAWGLKWGRAQRSKMGRRPFQTPTTARTKPPLSRTSQTEGMLQESLGIWVAYGLALAPTHPHGVSNSTHSIQQLHSPAGCR